MKHRPVTRLWGVFLALSIALLALSGCAGSSQDNDENTAASLSATEVSAQAAALYAAADVSWDSETAVSLLFENDTVTCSQTDVKISNNSVTITLAGTYRLSGAWAEGQLTVDAGDDADVKLVLDGVSLTSSAGSPLVMTKDNHSVTVILADGTDNQITDNTSDDSDDDTPDAAIYAKCDLTLGGDGSLTVRGNHQHGIVSKDTLVIVGGTYEVQAVKVGIRGKDALAIGGGNLTVVAGGDGLQASNDSDEEKGWISLDGGSGNITAAGDGIQAETVLAAADGEWSVLTGDGHSVSPNEETSTKGLKAGSHLYLTGGSWNIDSSDDAIHSNDKLTLAGGTLTVASGDDGLHADTDCQITGGTLTITASYEGIEGQNITISGGVLDVTASDDGVNASNGSSQMGGFGGMMGGFGGMMGGQDSSDISLVIDGGTLTVHAGGDGIDSNGSLTINGGLVIVHGPTGNDDAALDVGEGSDCLINGGTLIAIGSASMAITPSSSSTQCSLTATWDTDQSAGSLLSLFDQDGQPLLALTAEKSYRCATISSPALTQGSTVTLAVGGTCTGTQADSGYWETISQISDTTSSTEIELSSIVTTSGSLAGGQMGGQMGDQMGGQMGGGQNGDFDQSFGGVQGGDGTTPSMPDGETPSMPDGETPSMPDGGTTPSMPDGETPSMPDGTTPSMPDGETPSMPDGTTPSMPSGGDWQQQGGMMPGSSDPGGQGTAPSAS